LPQQSTIQGITNESGEREFLPDGTTSNEALNRELALITEGQTEQLSQHRINLMLLELNDLREDYYTIASMHEALPSGRVRIRLDEEFQFLSVVS
jgi:hypothetical protein